MNLKKYIFAACRLWEGDDDDLLDIYNLSFYFLARNVHFF